MAFVGMEWTNQTAVGVFCAGCGHIMQFVDQQNLSWTEDPETPIPWVPDLEE